MEILKRYIIAALVAISLTGCYKEIDLSGISDSVLCMNSLIEAGEPIFVTVSHSWLYSDRTDSQGNVIDVTVKDATVALYVNDEFVENLKFYTKPIYSNEYSAPESVDGYLSEYAPKAGDRIRLVAENSQYGKAEATVTMPDQVPIDKVEYTFDATSGGLYELYDNKYVFMGFNMDIYATLTDPKETTNYYIVDYVGDYNYEVHADHEDNDVVEFLINFGWMDSDVEPLLSEHISALESVFGAESYDPYFFSDMQISGISYPIHMRLRDNQFRAYVLDEDANYQSSVTFKLYNISEDYYKYLVYIWQVEDGMSGMLQDVGFGDSLLGYSNVSTNAGIVAAMTPTTVTIPLDNEIKQLVLSNIK